MTKAEILEAKKAGKNVSFDGGEIINSGIVLSEEKKAEAPKVEEPSVDENKPIEPDVKITIPLPTANTPDIAAIPDIPAVPASVAANAVQFPSLAEKKETEAPSFEMPNIPIYPQYDEPNVNNSAINNDYSSAGDMFYPSFGNNDNSINNNDKFNNLANDNTGNVVYPEFGSRGNMSQYDNYNVSNNNGILSELETSLASVKSRINEICRRNDMLESKNSADEAKIRDLERQLQSLEQQLRQQRAINKEVQGKILGLFGYNSALSAQPEEPTMSSYGDEQDLYSRNRAA